MKRLLLSVATGFCAVVFNSGLQAATNSNPRTHPKMSPGLVREIQALGATESTQERKIPALVFMLQQAHLEKAKDIRTKADRGKYVYKALVATAKSSQRSLTAWLQARNLTFKSYYLGNAIAVFDATPEILGQIASRPDVQRIVADPKVRIKMPAPELKRELRDEPVTGIGENLVKIGADRVWGEFGTRGEGIVIAGQDTGIQWDHPALKNSYRGWDGSKADHRYAWHDAIRSSMDPAIENRCGYDLKVPCDDNGHGTHTIGTVIGDDGGGNKIGVAPGAKWIGCRNMDSGVGAPHTYLECFEFFLAPYPQGGNAAADGKPELAPHVVNNSWGCDDSEDCDGSEFLGVLKAMEAAGIMVVASAGNNGPGCSTIDSAPAHHTDETLAVGAHDHRTDKIASFSSRGPSIFDNGTGPDVTAPGVDVRSAIPGNQYAGSGWSGTSMAGPHVVGQVALMWSAAPEMIGNLQDTVEIVRSTAQPRTTSQTCGGVPGAATPNNTFGFGTINAYESVKVARTKFGG